MPTSPTVNMRVISRFITSSTLYPGEEIIMAKKITKKELVTSVPPILEKALLADVRELIETTRREVAHSVNSALVMLYWRIGRRIRRDVLKEQRAKYGKQIISGIGKQLEMEFGRGFSGKSLRHMIRFAEAFPNKQIVSSLMRQLSWTHFLAIIYIKEPLQRDFYAEMCRLERWSTRTLQKKVGSMLYERTALSRKPDELILLELKNLRAEDILTPDLVFKDTYLLDFLGLNDRYLEKDLEDAILREMESFLLELGGGFSFMERQKRISVDDEDYYLDLLFYHRSLRRLVGIDLKLGKFKPEYKGQMELYLRWLEEHEQKPGEEPPIGLILCTGKSEEQITLLRLNRGNIRVAAYMTDLPSKKLLKQKLHTAIRIARNRLAQKLLNSQDG